MSICCLLLSSTSQMRKAVDLGVETEGRGTMMTGQAMGLIPRPTTTPLATPPPTLPDPLVYGNETAQSGPRPMATEEQSLHPASTSSPRSLCCLWWSLSPPCGDNRLLRLWAHWSRVLKEWWSFCLKHMSLGNLFANWSHQQTHERNWILYG